MKRLEKDCHKFIFMQNVGLKYENLISTKDKNDKLRY